ncbi:helix-turn-helix transcriptional regulator [Dehalobacter sp.]|uniref:helix-turn-helix domain-containing protein n=1 Tax=Dehalobacter sp. TaxID=1962289 RepID=UPI0025883739|nr:helix-turn-helix transcriptional regulator [Dehalobacter sp.]MDJ0305360.1 helix-turn-helix transcriptional regulator [Dehalobacter sp.]
MSIVENIKLLCKQYKTSIPKLENEFSFGHGAIYNWDKNSPSVDRLQKVADYFNVSIDFLLDREGFADPEDNDIQTIAAHHDGDDWTEEELEEIERFKEFVKSKKKQR